MTTHTTPLFNRARVLAALGAVTLALAACGGGASDEVSDVEGEVADLIEEMEEAAEETSEASDDDADGSFAQEVHPPEFHLPEPIDPPAGYDRIPAMCESDGEGAWITYAVPEDWENNSRGGGGSGSPLSTSVDLGFDLPDGGWVDVELDTEPRQPDGSITTRSGEPFESFDYDYSIGDDSTTITFDSLGTVSAGDQDVEVWVAPRDQAPDFLSTTEHKARFEAASLPNPAPGDDDGYMPASYVLTVVHNPDGVDLDDQVVTTLVESLALPACTVDRVQQEQELRFDQDFNGDGEVATPDDMFGG